MSDDCPARRFPVPQTSPGSRELFAKALSWAVQQGWCELQGAFLPYPAPWFLLLVHEGPWRSMKVHEGPWRSMVGYRKGWCTWQDTLKIPAVGKNSPCKSPWQLCSPRATLREKANQSAGTSIASKYQLCKIWHIYPPWSTNSLLYMHYVQSIYIYIIILNVPLVHWSKRRCFRNEAIFSPRGRWDVLATPPKGHFWGSTRGGELRALMLVN